MPMSISLLVPLLAAAAFPVHADSTSRRIVPPTPLVTAAPAGPARQVVPAPRLGRPAVPHEAMAGDTTRRAPIEYSDWYERRLTIHRVASYTTLPLFAFQYVAGSKLYEESTDAPSWAKSGHGAAATGLAALFAVNTVTGGWNLWDARKDPAGRKWRTAHAVLMLAADAGFAATGIMAEDAEHDPDGRRRHRTVAIGSMAVATTSYLMMLSPFRPD
jgi:hypothetical protein